MIEIKYNDKSKNIKILNSYLITDPRRMEMRLQSYKEFKNIERTMKSCINEWIAHNRLYNLGLFKEHCKDTNLSKNEKKHRLICYWILSRKIFKVLDK